MGELDLSNLECRLPEFLDIAYRKRLGDMVWRVCFCDGQSYILVLRALSVVSGKALRRAWRPGGCG